MDDANQSTIVEATCAGAEGLRLEVVYLGGEELVGRERLSLDASDLLPTIKGFAEQLGSAIAGVGAKSFTVEFGVTVGVESGHLIAIIAKGTLTANLKVTLAF